MEKEPQKLPRNSSALSGEYFVAAELYRRGYSVGMTIGNAKSVDLFAEKNGKTHQVQVKTIINKKSVGWPILKEQVKIKVIYVFVNLNDNEAPDYYILKPDEIIPLVQQYEKSHRGILQIGRVKSEKKYKNRWDRIK